MGRVTSGTGLVSGLDYQSIITQLMTFEQKPIDLLKTQLDKQKSIETAYTGISAQMLSLSLSINTFGQSSVLNARQATSSNPGVLTATASATAAPGAYTFRPLQQAQTQRFAGTGYASNTSLVGAGTITIKRGGFVTADTPLEALNGGSGVALGKIRVVDRSGASAVIDLTGAQTVGDVLSAINNNGTASVTASASGDSFVLTDHTGASTTSLGVQEIGAGTTAADLGIVGSIAGPVKTGTDVVKLGSSLKLSLLNDGLGVRRDGNLNDFRITLKNGATVDVKLGAAKTIGDVVTAINNDSQNSGSVTASISGSGDALVLTDNTGGGGTLAVSELNGSRAATDLGLLGAEQGGGVLTGKRTLAALNSTLLSNLRGGQGIATPGQVQLTDRTGTSALVDLTSASSLSDVITAINGTGLAITASINQQGHGITLTDTSGATTSNLIVADVGGGTTAANLNIAGSTTSTTISSGDLHRRYIDEGTLLSTLNGGDGFTPGAFKITDKAGNSAVINLTGNTYQTVGDVLSSINASTVGVTASINSTGDGILLTNTSGGSGTLIVQDLNGGKTAASLRLAGSGSATIDGAYTYSVAVDDNDTLNDVVTKLGQSGAPITASTLNAGGTDPLRLLVNSTKSGSSGRLLIDSGATTLNLTQSQQAQDAVLELTGTGATPLIFTSSTNNFASTVQGVSVSLLGSSTAPVTVTVADNPDSLVTALNQFVTGFNAVSTTISQQTAFDPATTTRGLLQGDGVAVELQSTLFSLVGRQYGSGGNSVRTFAQLGITLKSGQISLDENKLRAAISTDAASVRQFFGDLTTGAAGVMKKAVNSYTDARNGTLFHRTDGLDQDIQTLQGRIDDLTAGLDRKRTALQNKFLTLEQTLATIQSQQSSLATLANLAAQASVSSSSSSSSK